VRPVTPRAAATAKVSRHKGRIKPSSRSTPDGSG
jgi:hypothetical protein